MGWGAYNYPRGSNTHFGVVQCDGTSVMCPNGILSTTPGNVSAGNPAATAGPTAINGTASTFMRSDGAPAVQKGSTSQFGIGECDGTTIVCPGGVYSAQTPPVVSAVAYGADPTGVSDSTAAVQAALTALCATPSPSTGASGGTLAFPAGKFVLNVATGLTTSCAGVHIVGAGWGNRSGNTGNSQDAYGRGTWINITGSGSGALFNFMPAATNLGNYGSSIEKLSFVYSGNTTLSGGTQPQSGPAIQFNGCYGCWAREIYFYGASTGVVLNYGSTQKLEHLIFDQIAANSPGVILLSGTDGVAHACDSNLANCATRQDVAELAYIQGGGATPSGGGNQTGILIHIKDFVQTVHIDHVQADQVGKALYVECPTSGNINACSGFITVMNLETESNTTGWSTGAADGIDIGDSTDFICVACYSLGDSGTHTNLEIHGVRFNPWHAQVIGGRFSGAQTACIEADIQGYEQNGGTVYDCNRSAGAFGDIDIGAVSNGSMQGNNSVIGVNHCTYENTAYAKSAVLLQANAGDWNVVLGNRFRGCSSGVTDTSGGSHNVIANNAGP